MKQEAILSYRGAIGEHAVKQRIRIAKPVNFVLFQLSWFSCVLGAVWGLPLFGPVIALVVSGLHVSSTRKPGSELFFLVLACVTGTSLDLIPLYLGAFSFAVETGVPWGYPVWMSALWLGFATTFRSSLSWLSGRYTLAAIFGLVGGPLAYLAGEKLGAIMLGSDTLISLFVIGVFWAVVTPALFLLSDKLKEHDVTRG